MNTKEQFEEWLLQCPVDYCEVFGRNTYRFEVPREEITTDDNTNDSN